MAENNLIMTIVLVVAATLLFTGGLTGNVPRHNFAYAPSNVDTSGAVTCVPAYEGVVPQSGRAGIRYTNADCTTTFQECGESTSQPFVHREYAPQQFRVECRVPVRLSTAHPTSAVY